MKTFFKGVSMTLTAAMLVPLIPSAFAANDGLTGANIQDGQLIGYYGDGGDITVPNTVTMIGPEAFKGNDNVTSITIPGSVSVIGYSAFSGCTELERVIFSDPADGADLVIRVNAFEDCPKLVECEIPATAVYVTANVFKGCTSMDRITVDPQNKYYCTDDEGVMFGPWVSEGEPQYSDPNLTLIAYPSGREGHYSIPAEVNGRTVDRIWASAFRKAEKLTSVDIPETVTNIGGNAFEETGLERVVVPDTVTTFGTGVFESCPNLVEVTLPYGITEVPYSTFMGCNSLSRVNIPDTVNSIQMYSFTNCNSLTSLVLPNSVAYISLASFDGCKNLQRVVIPPSVTSFPGDDDVGSYNIFPNSPSSLIVYVEKDSIAARWAYNNLADWGFTYEELDSLDDISSIDAGTFYLMNGGKKVRVDGAFKLDTTLNVEEVTGGAEYDAFNEMVSEGSMKVYKIGLDPETASVPEEMKLSIGLPDGFTTSAKLYSRDEGELNAPIISRTFTADVNTLGYFAVIDGTVSGGDSTEVTKVTLNKTAAALKIGGKTQLSATVYPAAAADKSVKWSSSDETVATVDSKGIVTGAGAGTAVITATAVNGISASCTVTVTDGSNTEPTAVPTARPTAAPTATPISTSTPEPTAVPTADPDKIETNAGVKADRTAAEEGKAAFTLSLSEASRIATAEITFTTTTDDVTVVGRNGFTIIGEPQGSLKNGSYTATVVLSYLSGGDLYFSSNDTAEIASFLVNDPEEPSFRVENIRVAGFTANNAVAFGNVKNISPSEAVFERFRYDLNHDGIVDILDITQAQLYYRYSKGDEGWSRAAASDVNGDGIVDIRDLVEILMNFTE